MRREPGLRKTAIGEVRRRLRFHKSDPGTREGLTRAERTIAKWEHKAEHWTESDAQRTRMLQEATEKTQLAEADTSKLSAEYAAATEQWNDERNALRNRLAAHEFELERARSQQALRDNLASAIMHSAVDDGQRSDSVHFWQSRKLKWKSSVTTDVSDGTPDQPVGGVAIKTATPDPFAELPPDNFAQLPWRRGAATSATKYQLPVAAQAPYSKHELSPAPPSAPPPPPPPPPPPTPFGGSYSAHLLMQTGFGAATTATCWPTLGFASRSTFICCDTKWSALYDICTSSHGFECYGGSIACLVHGGRLCSLG